MENLNLFEMNERIIALKNDAYKLCISLGKDYDSDVNDWCFMWRVFQILNATVDKMFIYMKVECTPNSMENEKDKFEAQKLVRQFFQSEIESMNKDFDLVIDISRNWKMHDYRCQNFLRRMEETFLEFQKKINC